MQRTSYDKDRILGEENEERKINSRAAVTQPKTPLDWKIGN
jgi:hypothetical protein